MGAKVNKNKISDHSNLRIAVLGVSGSIGREVVSILAERRFPVEKIRGYASSKSVGEGIDYLDGEIIVEDLSAANLKDVDVAFNALPCPLRGQYSKLLQETGSLVVEVGGRADEGSTGVRLIVPEVNARVVKEELDSLGDDRGIVFGSPIAASTALSVVLSAFYPRMGIKRVVVSSYQSTAGAGRGGMDELWKQTLALFNGEEFQEERFPHQIAFNCFPQVGSFQQNQYTDEETLIISETRAVLDLPLLPITATAVQIPVFSCCGLSVNIEFDKEIAADSARELLSVSPGIIVLDKPEAGEYPSSFDLGGSDAVFVGRIRRDDSLPFALNLWIVADNLRKGSALNAVQIAELALESPRFKMFRH